MTRARQKEEERFFLDRFLQARGLVPERIQADESPDFLVSFGDCVTGIEITQLFHASAGPVPPQAMEGSRGRVVETARRLWEQRGGPHVEVHVLLDSTVHFSKAETEQAALALVNLVEESLPALDQCTRIEQDWTQPHRYPKGFVTCSVVRLASYADSYWLPQGAGWEPMLDPEHVIAAVQSKTRFERAGMSACWLVLVCDTFRISSSFQLPLEWVWEEIPSRFDRVFVLDVFKTKVIEVPVRPGTAHAV